MKVVKTDEVLKKGKISQLSPFLLIVRKFGLKHIIKEDEELNRPTVNFSIVVYKLTKVMSINSISDLCCGIGALNRIALRNGFEKIVFVDKNVDVINRIMIEEFFDLTVFDTPQNLLPRLFGKSKEFSLKSNIFVLRHARYEEKEWNEEIRVRWKEFFRVFYSFSVYGEEVSSFSFNQKEINWLKKFYEEW